MLGVTFSILLSLVQAAETGTLVGVVKLPNGARLAQPARVVLLPPKYIEVWNKQVQQRLDNYWETFKPEFVSNKEHFMDFYRVAHAESLRSVVATMRRELGEQASQLIKDTSPNGQFEFKGVSLGRYQLVVQASSDGQDVIWNKPVDVNTAIPIFVDLGKPVS